MQNKVENNNVNICYDEDEIDLRELLKTILKYKKFIVLFTFVITLIVIVYAYMATPIYEVKANVRVGYIGLDKDGNKNLLDKTDVIVQTLKVVFHVDDKVKHKKFMSEVKNISTPKKIKDIITIKSDAISNEKAVKKTQEVIAYLQKLYAPKIEQYKLDTQNQIENLEKKINDIKTFETENIKNQINILKKQKIKVIDNKIMILKTQDIKKLEKKIELLKNMDIQIIEKKIDFLKNVKIPALDGKISYYKKNLQKYNKAINTLYKSVNLSNNPTVTTISSIQMVNYQNLILDSQNHIEDFKLQIQKINEEIIPNLKNDKKKILEVKIPEIEEKISNIKNITIPELDKERENIKNGQIKSLEHKLRIVMPNNIINIKHKIKQLYFNISKQNITNSYLIGQIITNDYPIKPKKKLIVIVAFITGLILSIFLVFFIEFIKSFKDED